jgi:hypothetical protein
MRVTEAGVELDAEFSVDEIDGRLTFTMSSHSGSSGGRPRRNPECGEALRVISPVSPVSRPGSPMP